MKSIAFILIISFLNLAGSRSYAQQAREKVHDSLQVSGQLSVWGHYNRSNSLPLLFGGRYIPTINYSIKLPHDKLIDFEGSVNLFGTYATDPFDTSGVDGSISAYRAWARYSTQQFEIRAGLQKINFGSASMLRPLMWFDQIDPRDPLQLTNGVWGLLSRYYFLNNTNVWFWCLYGNDKARPWDIGNSAPRSPELGGRFQAPVPKGEMALSYNFRHAETTGMDSTIISSYSEIPEHRIGIDGKWDLGIGLWFEGTWIHKNINIGTLTNQELLTLGIDNTFNIGKGLNVVYEQMLASSDERAFAFDNNLMFSALSFNYPVGVIDNLSAIVYFDWRNKAFYNFVNWNHTFKRFTMYLMAYLNPKDYNLPQQGSVANMYSKQGLQLMLVYNH
jgi:hypothetical protein